MNYEELDLKKLEENLKTNFNNGLTEKEVNEKIKINGKNIIPDKKEKHFLWIFISHFFAPLQIILMFAAAFSIIAPIAINKGRNITFETFIDAIVIFTIIVVDAILETVQIIKTRKSVNALKKLSSPTTIVLRDGKQKEIEASNIVVGDIVLLETGKYIPADLRIIESADLMIDESILTGETVPVLKTSKTIKKTNILADKTNIVYMSTFVTNGRAIGVVINTGLNTEIGKIAKEINENDNQKTLLDKKLSKFSYVISIISTIVGVTVFSIIILSGNKNNWVEYLMISITLAIGIIPESLSAVVSIALSFSAKKMSSQGVIIKNVSIIETLGNVDVICTDKTGTLTINKMTISKLIWNNKILNSDEFIEIKNTEQKDVFLKSLVLPNDSITDDKERLGDPTELALVDFAEKMDVDELKYRKKYKRIFEKPFDSVRKTMLTINKIDNKEVVFIKGGMDEIINKCKFIYIDNKIIKLTSETKEKIINYSNDLSKEALRILSFAYKIKDNYDDESNLIFLGSVGMKDPIRVESIDAIQKAKDAGINTIMITGDHYLTAFAIARELNLATKESEIMNSDELEKLSMKQLEKRIDNIKVFSRVNPEHKTKIVAALQNKNKIVSMTGDGVNDAPSLSKADIGVSMGIVGTDVAKQASDLILTTDDFSKIILGINQGKKVIEKIKKVIILLMGFNLCNVLLISFYSIFLHIAVLNTVNILFINLAVESCLAITIAMASNNNDLIMKYDKSYNNKLLKGLIWPIFKIGIINSIVASFVFWIAMSNMDMSIWNDKYNLDAKNWVEFINKINSNPENYSLVLIDNFITTGRTFTFICVVLSSTFYVHFINFDNLNCLKKTNKINIKFKKTILFGSLITILVLILLLFTPGINGIFQLLPIISGTEKSIEYWNIDKIIPLISTILLSFITGLFLIFEKCTRVFITKYFFSNNKY